MKLKIIHFLLIGLITSTIATIGSLYFSFGMNLIPCELCWYQRILMYPITIIFLYSIYYNSIDIIKPTILLSTLGIIVSSYHSIIQRYDIINVDTCGGITCTNIDYKLFDLLTIPNLALIAFTIILIINILIIKKYS